MLAKCPELGHLDLSGNYKFGSGGVRGAERLAGVMGQYRELVHLNLNGNKIGASGAERLTGVLSQCPALARLELWGNDICAVEKGRLRGSWCGQTSGLVLWTPDTDCSLPSV